MHLEKTECRLGMVTVYSGEMQHGGLPTSDWQMASLCLASLWVPGMPVGHREGQESS